MVNGSAVLSWQATNDGDDGGFEVERSPDGLLFQKVGDIKARKEPGIFKYSFTDKEPPFEKNYYRLRIYDQSGAKISKVIILRKEILQQFYITNPFINKIEVRFSSLPKKVHLTLSDANGKIVSNQILNSPQMARIGEGAYLAPGVYFLRMNIDGKQHVQKLLKQ
jgi:hypothetical protein